MRQRYEGSKFHKKWNNRLAQCSLATNLQFVKQTKTTTTKNPNTVSAKYNNVKYKILRYTCTWFRFYYIFLVMSFYY